jgi:hypothetical protein
MNMRRTAIIVGVLFIIGTVFLFIGQAVYGPVLDSPDWLEKAFPNRAAVVLGILLELMSVLALPFIPAIAFPVLRKWSEPSALAYLGMRLFESVLLSLALIDKLSLIDISRRFLTPGGADAAYLRNTGNSILSGNSFGGPSGLIYLAVFTAGAVVFSAVLFRSRLVPRFISVWGLAAAPFMTIGAVLFAVGALSGAAEPVLQIVFPVPLAVQEIVLAVWLIARGFNPKALEAGGAA